jgi:hypothetical protein
LYNYALNLTTVAIVDLLQQKVLSVDHYPQAQADIPADLNALAIQIATQHPEVERALGFKPSASLPVMSNTKTSLNRTRCERSQHLCVAPTFVQGNRALWAIVDLTDLRLVGLRWTDLGKDGAAQVATERKLQNENLADKYCDQVNRLQQMGWQMDYVITSSDGLQISDVRFKDAPVLRSAKLVDWHVNYSGTDGFGYSDAVGCPIFSQAAVVATDPPKVVDVVEGDSTVGFMLEQLFYSELWPTPCHYSYSQRYFFYKDGRFRVSAGSIGRGCGNNGTYRPVFRIAFAGEKQQFAAANKGGLWQVWNKENWVGPIVSPPTGSPFAFRIKTDKTQAYGMELGTGQFNDGGRGDQPFVYVTLGHKDKDEGEKDLITIGPCCNTDYRQGPEKFMVPQREAILDKPLVIWYVPQLKNDDRPGAKYCWAETYWENGRYKIKTYPCFAGPQFVPVK